MLKYVLTALMGFASIQSSQAAIIDFSTNSSIKQFTGTYTQNGFDVKYTGGKLRLVDGNAAFGDFLAAGDSTGGSFDLSRSDGGKFSLGNFIGSSGQGNVLITYDILGFLGGINTYSQTLTQTTPGKSGDPNWTLLTFDPTPKANVFDRINFSMRTTASSAVIDNINVTEIKAATPDPVPPLTSAVPEPATWAMMLIGFGFVGSAMRRRHQRVAVLSA